MRARGLSGADLRVAAQRAAVYPAGCGVAYIAMPDRLVTHEAEAAALLRRNPNISALGDPVAAVAVHRDEITCDGLRRILDSLIDVIPDFLDRLDADPRAVAAQLLAAAGAAP